MLKGENNGTVGRTRNPWYSYNMPGACEYRWGVWQDYYNSSSSKSPNHLEPRMHCCCIINFSSPTTCTWAYLFYTPLYASAPMYVLATILPCITQLATFESRSSRPVTLPGCVETAQLLQLSIDCSLIELTAGVFEILLQKKKVHHTLPADSPGTVQVRPRSPPAQSGSGSKMREFGAERRFSSQVSTSKSQ